MSVTLGIDIGTSGTKTLAVRETGEILASSSAEYPCSYPRPGWSEQHPDLWWDATCKTVRDVLYKANLRPDEIKGIGLSGQMHGSVFLDERGQVVRPALLWNDQRTQAECDEIESLAGGREALVRLVSNRALTGYTAPKILWLRRHEPHHWERVRTILLPKDYIRYRLSGTFATEVSDASGMLLLDVQNRRWSDELLRKLDLDRRLFADCTESPAVSAQVSEAGATATGLAVGTSIVGGAGDQPAGAVGNGIVRPGVLSATMGTSGVVFAHLGQLGFDPEGRLQRFCHAVPNEYCAFGVVLAAGGSFQWFRNELGKAEVAAAQAQGVDPYFLLTDEAATVGPGAEGLFFLPYLTGERTPHFDAEARAAWVGLTVRHGRAHMIRALLEGATYAMRDCLELIREVGTTVSQIRLSGGGARNPLWRQIQADIYGTPCCTINASEGPAFGVALLALVGAGSYASVPEACDATISLADQLLPDPHTQSFYNEAYGVYRQLYPALRPIFPLLSSLSQRG